MKRPHLLRGLRVRSLVLLGALLLVLVTVPLESLGLGLTPIVRLCYTAVLCIGGYLLAPTRRWLMFFLAVAIPSLLVGLLGTTSGTGSSLGLVHDVLVSLVQIGLLWAVIAFALFDQEADRIDRVVAGICGYVILAFFWSGLYGLVETLTPGSLLDGGQAVNMTDGSLLYFSLVTLTTLGYGDILPVTPLARTLAGLESMTGSLYLAVFVAALISGLGPSRAKDSAGAT